MTIASYRSDFGLFLEFLRLRARGRGRGGRARSRRLRTDAVGLRAFTTALIRDYQQHMATRHWSINTVRRRLVELSRFAGWLVERRHLQRSPMIGVSVPRRERRLPRVLDWSQVEQIVAAERKRRDRAILALLAYGGLRRGEVMAADVGDYSREAPSLMVHGKGARKRAPISPGHSPYRLAKDIGVQPRRIREIVRGRRGVTADTALRLARYFSTSERFWLNLQAGHDLEIERDRLGARLYKDVRVLAKG
jgi:addiction module HigA family antidote